MEMAEVQPSPAQSLEEELNEALLACAICGEAFTSMAALDGHLDSCHNPFGNDALMACGACGELFTLLEYLQHHVENVHSKGQTPVNASEGLYVCVGCDVHFHDTTQLKDHLRTHGSDGVSLEQQDGQVAESGLNVSLRSDADLECLMSDNDNELEEIPLSVETQADNSVKENNDAIKRSALSSTPDPENLSPTAIATNEATEGSALSSTLNTEKLSPIAISTNDTTVGSALSSIPNTGKLPPIAIATTDDTGQQIRKSRRGRPRKTVETVSGNFCEVCQESFHARQDLLDHKRLLHGQNTCICMLCGEGLLGRLLLDHHMSSVHHVMVKKRGRGRPRKDEQYGNISSPVNSKIINTLSHEVDSPQKGRRDSNLQEHSHINPQKDSQDLNIQENSYVTPQVGRLESRDSDVQADSHVTPQESRQDSNLQEDSHITPQKDRQDNIQEDIRAGYDVALERSAIAQGTKRKSLDVISIKQPIKRGRGRPPKKKKSPKSKVIPECAGAVKDSSENAKETDSEHSAKKDSWESDSHEIANSTESGANERMDALENSAIERNGSIESSAIEGEGSLESSANVIKQSIESSPNERKVSLEIGTIESNDIQNHNYSIKTSQGNVPTLKDLAAHVIETEKRKSNRSHESCQDNGIPRKSGSSEAAQSLSGCKDVAKRQGGKPRRRYIKIKRPPRKGNRGRPRKQRSCPICGEHFSAIFLYLAHMSSAHGGQKQGRKTRESESEQPGQKLPESESESPGRKLPESEFESPERKPWELKSESPVTKTLEVKLERVKLYSCEYCGRDFLKKTDLEEHRLIKHSDDEEPSPSVRVNLPRIRGFRCEVCKRVFKKKSHLEEHVWTHTNRLPWQCRLCDKGFRRETQLAVHMDQTHLGEQVTAVQMEQVEGDSPNSSLEPTVKAETFKPFECEVCYEVFSRKCDIELHMWSHLNSTELKCMGCGEVFDDEVTLTAHAQQCYQDKPAEQAPVISLKKRAAVVNRKRFFDDRPFECEFCSKSFKRRCHLADHAWTHKKKRPFQCKYCDKSFIRGTQLAGHISYRHPNVDPQQYLDQLGDEAKSKIDDPDYEDDDETYELPGSSKSPRLTKEERLKRSSWKYPHRCEVCKQRFQNRHHVQEHLWTHTSQKPYNCVYCQKGFSRLRALIVHISRHNGIELETRSRKHAKVGELLRKKGKTAVLFSCSYCPKKYGMKNALITHIPTHFTQIEFACVYCDQKFTKEKLFQKHALQHDKEALDKASQNEPAENEPTQPAYMYDKNASQFYVLSGPERPFPCEVCGKAFKTKAHLKEHMWIHSDKKPYTCNVCQKGFCRQNVYRRHMADHSVKVPEKLISASGSNSKVVMRSQPVNKVASRKCHICMKAFKFKSHLQEHMWTHYKKEKPFQCTLCARGFVRAKLYRKHMKMTHGKKNVRMCRAGYMGAKAKKQTSTKTADKTQVPERRFKCYVCEQTFGSKDEVISHLALHSEPFLPPVDQFPPPVDQFPPPVNQFPPPVDQFQNLNSIINGAQRDIDSMSTDTSPETLLEQECIDMLTPMDVYERDLDRVGLGREPEIDDDVILMSDSSRPTIEIDRGMDPMIEIDHGIDPIIELDQDDDDISVPSGSINRNSDMVRVITIDVNNEPPAEPERDPIFKEPSETDSEPLFVDLEYPDPSMPDAGGNVIGQIVIKPEYDHDD